MAIAIIEARRRAAENRELHERLVERHAKIVERCAEEELRQDVLRARIHRDLLTPFAESFSRLRNVHLADFEDFEMPGVRAMPVVDLVSELQAAIRAGRTLLGGAGTGATGGGGMAAGAAVLGSAVVVPALVVGLGVGTVLSRRDLRNDGQVKAELALAGAQLDQEQSRVDAVLRRAEHLRGILRRLLDAGLEVLGGVATMIDDLDDVRLWSTSDRSRAATLVSLVVVVNRLMRAPLVDGSGAVADRDGGALADAHRWLRAYDGEAR